MDEKEAITKKEKQRKKPKYMMFIMFFFFFIGGYTLFFTSTFWMPDTGIAKRKTELHREIEWNKRVVSLLRWEYSEKQNLMEIEIEVTNKEFDKKNNYEFSVMESNGKRLKVDSILVEPDWIIVQVRNVPKRFRELSLHMGIENDDNEGYVRFYTNKNDVERVEKIKKKSKKEYMVVRLEETVAGYHEKIEEIEKEIEKEQKSIAEIEKEIMRLEAKMPYQTDEEVEQTQKLIDDAKYTIDSSNSTIEKKHQLIEEYHTRIEKTEEKAAEVQSSFQK